MCDVENNGCGVLVVSSVDKFGNASAKYSCSKYSSVSEFGLDNVIIEKRLIGRRLDLVRESKSLDVQEGIEHATLKCIVCPLKDKPLSIKDRDVKSEVTDYVESNTCKAYLVSVFGL